jgi:hypothetical protein
MKYGQIAVCRPIAGSILLLSCRCRFTEELVFKGEKKG